MTTSSPALSILYVGDPMCSWCYGFGVPLAQLRTQFPDVPVHLMLGGLRAYNTTVMDAVMKDKIRQHWLDVGRRSGQPFSYSIFERNDFIYDTEPACRAVATVRRHAPALALPMYHAIQQAFYAQGRDVTQAMVLGEVWDEVAGSAGEAWGAIDFLRDFESETLKQLTRADFEQAQRWGIRGFPTLLAVADGQAQIITHGYTEAAVLAEKLASLIARRSRLDPPA